MSREKKTVWELERFALEIRRQTIRELHSLGSGHVGGCMSIVELLAVLYGERLQVDPANPRWEERDRLPDRRDTPDRRSTPPWPCGDSSPWSSWKR